MAIGGTPRIDIDAADFAENLALILAIATRRVSIALIIGRSAIAHSEVEEPIRTDAHGSAIVIELGFVEAQYLAPTGRIHSVAVGGINSPFGNDLLMVVGTATGHGDRKIRSWTVRFRGVGVNERELCEICVQSQANQASLVVSGLQGDQSISEIEQRNRQHASVLEDIDEPDLIVDEEPSASVIRHGCADG